MLFYAGVAEFDMTKATVTLYYSALTKVATDHILGTVIHVKF